jgi:hypothetical protein
MIFLATFIRDWNSNYVKERIITLCLLLTHVIGAPPNMNTIFYWFYFV